MSDTELCVCVCLHVRNKNHVSFPARRLWHYLVKQDLLQDTLIRYIFTKKRKQSEVQWRRAPCCIPWF